MNEDRIIDLLEAMKTHPAFNLIRNDLVGNSFDLDNAVDEAIELVKQTGLLGLNSRGGQTMTNLPTFDDVWKELEKEDKAFITARKQSEEIVKFINDNCRECNKVDREMYENCEQCGFLKAFLK